MQRTKALWIAECKNKVVEYCSLRIALATHFTLYRSIRAVNHEKHVLFGCTWFTSLSKTPFNAGEIISAIQEALVWQVGIFTLVFKVVRAVGPESVTFDHQRNETWQDMICFLAKQLVMVVSMYFNHFAIHHTSPAKLHTAFWIASSAVSQYLQKQTSKNQRQRKLETNAYSWSGRQKRFKLLQKMWSQSSSLSFMTGWKHPGQSL